MKTRKKQEPKIQAIETYYKKTRFRSRLEARWAVFFDAIGLGWEYEPEGYTDGKISYLPDFWLPGLQMFFEVKPNCDKSDEQMKIDAEKINMLSKGTGRPVIMSVGPPVCDFNLIYSPTDNEWDMLRVQSGPFCLMEDRKTDGEFWLSGMGGCEFSIGPIHGEWHEAHPVFSQKIINAINRSRIYRFW